MEVQQQQKAMQFKGDTEIGSRIFEWGKKEKILKEVHKELNRDGLFAGQLKFFTLKDKWRKAEKQAEDIVKNDKEKWIKLWQNGGTGDLSELQQLYLDLAGTMKATRDKKEQELQEAKDEDHNVQERLDAAMETVAKQCG